MRLFLAYSIDENDKKKLLGNIKFLKKRYSNVRWIKEENLHLTIKFLGETDRKDDIINIINDKIKNNKIKRIKLPLRIVKITGFPSINNARVIVCVFEENENLIGNFFEVDRSLEVLGFKRETRDFKSHITIGRIKSKNNYKRIMNEFDIDGIEVRLTGLKLFRSILKPEGAEYSVIYDFEKER